MVNLFGMEPWEVLRAATAYGGEAWAGNSNVLIGQIKKNYLADLIIVDGNPIKDIGLLSDKTHILGVMKNGDFYRKPTN
jgi:imidazolonepropionase-like amidohydrolase